MLHALQSHDPHAGNALPVTLGTLGPHPAVSEGAWAPYAAGSTEQKPAGRLVSSSSESGRSAPIASRCVWCGLQACAVGAQRLDVALCTSSHTSVLSHSVGPKALLALKRGTLQHSVTHARERPQPPWHGSRCGSPMHGAHAHAWRRRPQPHSTACVALRDMSHATTTSSTASIDCITFFLATIPSTN